MVIVIVIAVFMFLTGMPVTVSHFIASEILEVSRPVVLIEVLAAMRVFAVIAVATIVVPIDMTPKVAVTMKPWARTEKDAVREPFGSVVAIRGAIVGRVIEVAVWAHRRRANLDCNLRLRFLWRP